MNNRDSFSGPQQNLLRAALSRFSWRTAERGRIYLIQRRVQDIVVTDDQVSAVVIGSEHYEVDWKWSEGIWTCDCSCPLGIDCKHAYALGLEILRWPPRVGLSTPTGGKLVTSGRPAPRRTDFAAILRAEGDWGRREALHSLLSQPPLRLNSYQSTYQEIMNEVYPERDPELACWMLAQRLLSLHYRELPPELEPYRDRMDLREQHAERERERLTKALLTWVTGKAKVLPRTLRFEWSLSALDRRIGLIVEGRLTTARLVDAPRSVDQLRQLQAEALRRSGTLSSEQNLLLTTFLETLQRTGISDSMVSPAVAVSMLKVIGGESPLMTWSPTIQPEAAQRAGITPGAPLRMASQALRLLPAVVTGEQGAQLRLMCVWPNDTQRALDEVLYFASRGHNPTPSWVVADGCFYMVSEEPPAELRDRFLTLGSLQVPADRCAEMLTPLAQQFTHVRTALANHTRLIGGKPIIALDLRDDDWLQIRVFVHDGVEPWIPHQAAPSGNLLELMPNSLWSRAAGEARNATDAFEEIPPATARELPPDVVEPAASEAAGSEGPVWIETADPDIVAPAVNWLSATGAEAGGNARLEQDGLQAADRGVGWWVQATARRMSTLAELWDTRPPEVQFFGSERVHRLLSGTQTVRPKLSIQSSGLDWFSVSAQWEAEGLSLTDADMAKLRSSKSRFVKLAAGWVRRDAIDAHDQAAETLADLGIEVGGGEQRLTLWQLAGAKQESIAALAQMGADPKALRALSKLRRQLREFKGVPEVPVPASLKAELRPYQKRGLDFLVYTSNLDIGAVLADDMGLGKTVQALAWLQTLILHKPKGGPSLVVCPTSVMHNWQREAAQFTPNLKVIALERGGERHELRKELHLYDLVITNYALLRRDLEEWKEIKLRALILDEAQNIKNPDAAVSKAATALQAQHRLALTGTPLENRPLDLWSITNAINPGYLGNRSQFSLRFDRVDAAPHARTLLAAKLRPILLRRLKRDVAADLPERIEERRDCELTEGQRQLYLAELRRSRKLVDELSEDAGGLRKNKITILAALTRLRQICCHPALAKGKASLGSGKFDSLFELLEPLLAEGHKVLLFSQFVQCLNLIEKEMDRRDIPHHKLTGQTVKREAVVQAFQEDPNPSVFLISLKAGGTGLNLTAASYVVLFDPWWNPAVEAQAIDRTHRIGQDRTVIAYRMLTRGTIEEKIWELQQKKMAMVRDVLGEDGFARALSRDDLSFLLQES